MKKLIFLLMLLTGFSFAQTGKCPANAEPVIVNTAASGDTTVVTATTSTERIIVWKYVLENRDATSTNNVNFYFKLGTTQKTGVLQMNGNGGSASGLCDGVAYVYGGAGQNIVLNLDAARQVNGTLYITREQN